MIQPLRSLLRWAALGSLIGLLTGSAGALFLFLLGRATEIRLAQPLWIWGLPAAGALLGWAYQAFGQEVLAGNNLVLDRYHNGGRALPLRMGPMVMLGTVWSHLFGASVGREGTGVQMGASLADAVSQGLKLDPRLRRQLLAAGVAAGLASVFGTPLAGVVFGLEVAVLGELDYEALVPALFAAFLGDWCTRAWGIQHTAFPAVEGLRLDPGSALRWSALAVAVAAAAWTFIEATHWLKARGAALLPPLPLRLAVGGLAVVALWRLLDAGDCLGLSTPLITQCLGPTPPPPWTFGVKLLLTVLSLGFGFIGGEVTPLFVTGACLGSALAPWLGLPPALAAAVGLAALFGACANTPLAMTVMGVELFGGGVLAPTAWVAVLAWLLSGPRGIYATQRLKRPKHGGESASPQPTLGSLRAPAASAGGRPARARKPGRSRT